MQLCRRLESADFKFVQKLLPGVSRLLPFACSWLVITVDYVVPFPSNRFGLVQYKIKSPCDRSDDTYLDMPGMCMNGGPLSSANIVSGEASVTAASNGCIIVLVSSFLKLQLCLAAFEAPLVREAEGNGAYESNVQSPLCATRSCCRHFRPSELGSTDR